MILERWPLEIQSMTRRFLGKRVRIVLLKRVWKGRNVGRIDDAAYPDTNAGTRQRCQRMATALDQAVFGRIG